MKKTKNWLPHDEYLKTLSRRVTGVGVIMRNSLGEVLLEEPSYRDHWIIPGGMVDTEESPRVTGEREIQEETGIKVNLNKVISVMYLNSTADRPESLHFYFDGGVLTNDQISKLKVDNDEIVDFKFIKTKEIVNYTGENIANLLIKILDGLENNKMVYLENWKVI